MRPSLASAGVCYIGRHIHEYACHILSKPDRENQNYCDYGKAFFYLLYLVQKRT